MGDFHHGLLQEAPFFSYVVLAENHSPHDCVNFGTGRDFVTTFTGASPFDINCQLNEYIRRLDATWEAFEMWDQYLRDLETSTGRPYVLLVFGDHQPTAFTLSGYTFGAERTGLSLRETFFHLRSSRKGVIRCCTVSPPATVLPTLLSAYVASDLDDLYLPISLYLYMSCGSDLLDEGISWGIYGFSEASATTSSPLCQKAVKRGLAAIHAAGIL